MLKKLMTRMLFFDFDCFCPAQAYLACADFFLVYPYLFLAACHLKLMFVVKKVSAIIFKVGWLEIAASG